MLHEIGFAKKPAVLLHEFVDRVCDLPFVKRVPALFADQAQRFRQGRILEDVALCGGAAFAIKCVGLQKCAGKPLVNARTEGPVVRDQFCDGKTFLGVTNRRGKVVA